MIRVENKNVWEHIKKRFLVAGDADDERLKSEPFCGILSQYNIAHLGVKETGHPYELSRVHQNGSCLVASIEGEGKVLVDGKWVRLPAGKACLLPPFVDNSIKTVSGNWKFIWVKYLEDKGVKPVASSMSPVVSDMDAQPLLHACMGLYATCSNKEQGQIASTENLWVELIQKHVLNYARPRISDKRLWKLWMKVDTSVAKPWRLEEMASYANMSPEHLRRLCKKEFGRSPKQHLCFLRMRQARILLGATTLKIETIANRVGYADVFLFSNMFKKYMGHRPFEMR